MRSTLQSFRWAFEKYIDTGASRDRFQCMREACPDLAGFRTPRDLVAHQHSEKLVSPDQKDRVLYALIRAYQDRESLRLPAEVLLFLAMYPALARVHNQLTHLYSDEADCAAEVRLDFVCQVALWKPDKRDCIAANLWMNTRRTILRRKQKEQREQNTIEETSAAARLLLVDEEAAEASVTHFWGLAAHGSPSYEFDDIELERPRMWLRETCGTSDVEADILIARLLCRLSWKAVSERVGMKPETARKKAREVVQTVRNVAGVRESCPGFHDCMCVPQVEGEEDRTLH
jgi:hypothetical protein